MRDFRGIRWVRIGLRTGHIISFSGLVGGHLFGAAEADLTPWLIAAVATGAAMIALNLYQSAVWLREVRGAVIIAKCVALCALPLWPAAAVPILVVVIVASSIVSHMPGRYRYWILGQGPRDSTPKSARG